MYLETKAVEVKYKTNKHKINWWQIKVFLFVSLFLSVSFFAFLISFIAPKAHSDNTFSTRHVIATQ